MILSFVYRIKKKYRGKRGENGTERLNANFFAPQSLGNFKASTIAQPEFHISIVYLKEKNKSFTTFFMLHIFISDSTIHKTDRKIYSGCIANNKKTTH